MIKERSAGAVVFHENKSRKYLLLKYAGKEHEYWDFVKGNIEKNENEKETVVRELKEETGIDNVDFIVGFKEKIHFFYKRDDKLISKDVVFYLLKTDETKVKISFEHIGYDWLEYEKALKQATFKNAKDILKKAEAFLKKRLTNY